MRDLAWVSAELISPGNVTEALRIGERCFTHKGEVAAVNKCYLEFSQGIKRVDDNAFGQTGRDRVAYYLFRDSEGNPVGIGGIYQSDDKPKSEFSIGWFGVDPSFQRKGFGEAIIAFLEEDARKRGGEKISVFTPESNQRALNFYKKIGYSVESIYPHGKVVEMVLEKKL